MNIGEYKITVTETLKRLEGTPFAIKRPALNDWINRGFIIASEPAPSPGSTSYFSLFDLYQIGIFTFLVRDFGCSREEARAALDSVGERFDSFLKGRKGKHINMFDIERAAGEIYIYVNMINKKYEFYSTAFMTLDQRKKASGVIHEYVLNTVEHNVGDSISEKLLKGLKFVSLYPIVRDINEIFLDRIKEIADHKFSPSEFKAILDDYKRLQNST